MEDDNSANETPWQEAVPEFAREWNEVKGAENMEALFNRIGEQRTFIGNSIRIPTEDASPETVEEFNRKMIDKVPQLMKTPDLDDPDSINQLMQRLGMPENVEGYANVEGEDLKFKEGQMTELKTMALDLGLTKKQFEKLATKIGSEAGQNSSLQNDQIKAETDKLQTEWGLSAEAKYQQTLNFVKQAGAPQDLIDGLVNKQINAATVVWLNSLATGMSEQTNITSQPNHASGAALSPDEAQSRINEMLSNSDHPYHRGDPAARKKMHELMHFASPGKYGT